VGGWRRFSIERRLLEQDALVFQLVEPDKFKVTSFNPVDFAPCLIILQNV